MRYKISGLQAFHSSNPKQILTDRKVSEDRMAVKLFSCLLCFLFLVMLFSPGSHASLNGACMGLPPGRCGRKVERSRKINFHVRILQSFVWVNPFLYSFNTREKSCYAGVFQKPWWNEVSCLGLFYPRKVKFTPRINILVIFVALRVSSESYIYC